MIQRLTVADERAARVVRERAEAGQRPAETVAKAVEIGARVLDSEETAANVDYVRAEFERHAGALRERLMKQLEAGDDALSERIAGTFDGSRDGSVQKDIEALVESSLEGQREAILKLLRVEDGANPLFDLQADHGHGLQRPAGRASEGRGREPQGDRRPAPRGRLSSRSARSPTSGSPRPRRPGRARAGASRSSSTPRSSASPRARGTQRATSATSPRRQEARRATRSSRWVRRSAAPLATVVFEAKNKRLSKNDAWSELNACMRERDAAYSVLVVAGEDKVPAGLEELTEYQGNKIIAVLDREEPDPLALRLVYRYVRARVLATRDSTLQVDAAGVRDAAEEAQAALKRVNRVRKSLTGITNGAEAARTELNDMMDDVEACLIRIDSLVAAAAQDEQTDTSQFRG